VRLSTSEHGRPLPSSNTSTRCSGSQLRKASSRWPRHAWKLYKQAGEQPTLQSIHHHPLVATDPFGDTWTLLRDNACSSNRNHNSSRLSERNRRCLLQTIQSLPSRRDQRREPSLPASMP
jgi:hypothetical protein